MMVGAHGGSLLAVLLLIEGGREGASSVCGVRGSSSTLGMQPSCRGINSLCA